MKGRFSIIPGSRRRRRSQASTAACVQAMDELIRRALQAMSARPPSPLMLDLVSALMDQQARLLARSLVADYGGDVSLMNAQENVLESRRQIRVVFASMIPRMAKA
jgi:hypothetical protein